MVEVLGELGRGVPLLKREIRPLSRNCMASGSKVTEVPKTDSQAPLRAPRGRHTPARRDHGPNRITSPTIVEAKAIQNVDSFVLKRSPPRGFSRSAPGARSGLFLSISIPSSSSPIRGLCGNPPRPRGPCLTWRGSRRG
jgi:hypothetical protein